MNTKKIILINATALNASGALSILKQFIEAIPDDKYEYILFVNNKVNLAKTNHNIRFISKDFKSLRERFIWDAFGVKEWLKKNKINPSATISLQNTNFRTNKSIPNFIYYHQSIPFFNKKWNPFNLSERPLWFYKNIYPFFIKLFINKKTEIFVQTNFMRDRFAQHFDFPKNKIHIIRPRLELAVVEDDKQTRIDTNQLNLFYPATPFVYKNHTTIIKALSLLDQKYQKKITLHLTCEKQNLDHLLINTKIYFLINYMGKISFNKVLGMYKEADALLFPSYIETIGLPLLEAASFGMPIIASDLPYSHEVLKGYTGVTYALFDNPRLWSEKISAIFTCKGQRFQPFKLEQSNSWPELFRILKNKI